MLSHFSFTTIKKEGGREGITDRSFKNIYLYYLRMLKKKFFGIIVFNLIKLSN